MISDSESDDGTTSIITLRIRNKPTGRRRGQPRKGTLIDDDSSNVSEDETG